MSTTAGKLATFAALSVSCFMLPKTAGAAPACGGHGTRDSMLVSTAWLAGHLQDPNLVILSVGQRAEYVQGHIPGDEAAGLLGEAPQAVCHHRHVDVARHSQHWKYKRNDCARPGWGPRAGIGDR